MARALIRAAYRLVRFPFHLVDEVVLSAIFDEQAPVRRAYGKFLLDCDGAARTFSPTTRRRSMPPSTTRSPAIPVASTPNPTS